MHHPQPLHLSLSTDITPVSSDCINASRGQAATHGGFSHSRHVTGMFMSWFILTTLILDLSGLNAFSLVIAQMYSQTWQPTHLSGSAETNFLSCIFFTISYAPTLVSTMYIRSSIPSSFSFSLVGTPSFVHPRDS